MWQLRQLKGFERGRERERDCADAMDLFHYFSEKIFLTNDSSACLLQNNSQIPNQFYLFGIILSFYKSPAKRVSGYSIAFRFCLVIMVLCHVLVAEVTSHKYLGDVAQL